MKKIIAINFTLLLMICFSHQALAAKRFRIEGSFNHYSVRDPLFKEVYKKGGLMLGGSFSFELINKFELRTEINYFKKTGAMTITEEV
jgi:hypothetical protein